ncbi:hypothetical protein OO013_07800 [Mangrovivirga sp. M17]|uniref:Uncharacterized protein n=1 Tax=Mangrovivirga halotolerans TaxID=2993936 RepID=A0ABT3RQE7_9BACT|nr:hypothetical protein [Mangrovivirga halotolerans]MCX2743763.1 hypothetical protein [Mangrovivirga halotolerans]
MINQLINKIEAKPKQLFLIDGSGAILSAFLLGVVLIRFENIFGIPASTLYFLAAIPVFFAVYDIISFRKDIGKAATLLKGIAIMNLLYCCLSVGMAIYHQNTITLFGWAYILSEVLIVIALSIFEIRISKSVLS